VKKTNYLLTSFLFFSLLFSSFPAAAAKNGDVINLFPTNDSGLFLSIYDSHTFGWRSFSIRTVWNYAPRTLELNNTSGRRVRGVIDDLLITDIGGAIGILPWWHIGFNQPVILWQTYQDPSLLTTTAPKENRFGKLGDPRLDMKFRLLENYRTPLGIAIIPFVYLPYGDEEHFLGNGMWSPGATLALDTSLRKRLFFAFNITYRNYEKFQYRTGANSFIDDTLGFGLGFRIQMSEKLALLSELWGESVISSFAKNSLQNPSEFLAGLRYEPSRKKSHLGMTLAGGRSIVSGLGSPEYRVTAGIDYLHYASAKKEKQKEAEKEKKEKRREEKKIIEFKIDQKIHFSFASAYIKEVWNPVLEEVATFLLKHPRLNKMIVEGYTDVLGPQKYNQRLSEERAKAVRDALIARGVEPDRLEVIGFGSSQPLADNATAAGRALNRRVEFSLPVQQP